MQPGRTTMPPLSPLPSSAVSPPLWDRQSGRGRMDAWINPSIHSFRLRRATAFLCPPLSCGARACGKELVINLCVTLFVNGDKKKDRLRRMRRWRLLHCFNLSQYITAWLASKKKASPRYWAGRHSDIYQASGGRLKIFTFSSLVPISLIQLCIW